MQTTHHPTLPLRERQRQEREEIIIQVAEEVLLEKGYYETSLDEIASRVGIARGTIYSHFPGKEELVFAIFKRDMQKFLQEIDRISETQPTPRAKLEALMVFAYTGFFSKQAHMMVSAYNGIDLKRLLMEKGGCMSDMWQSLVTRITELLEAGKKVGEFDPTIPTSAMIYALMCIISPQAYEHLFLNSGLSQAEIVSYLQKIYFNGITNDGTK